MPIYKVHVVFTVATESEEDIEDILNGAITLSPTVIDFEIKKVEEKI